MSNEHGNSSSEHLSTVINRSADDVYDFVVNPANLHAWAAGLANSPVRLVDDDWVADSPMGRVKVKFAERNTFGVLDHEVTLPDGSIALNPMRVLPLSPSSCEVTFTARRRDMADEEFAHDQELITTDLAKLKTLLEH